MLLLFRLLMVLASLLITTGCATSLPKDHVEGGKTYKNAVDIRINGFRRTYLVHIPSGYKPETPLTLVVVIHPLIDGLRRINLTAVEASAQFSGK